MRGKPPKLKANFRLANIAFWASSNSRPVKQISLNPSREGRRFGHPLTGQLGPPLVFEEPRMMENSGDPLPVQLLAPWIEDNEKFQHELSARNDRLSDVLRLRDKLDIRIASPSPRCTLDAVDASQCEVEFGDQLSILVQGARVRDDGATEFGAPRRLTGINGHETSLAAMPIRLAEECRLLAASNTPTIADLSYWSLLMDVNRVIARHDQSSNAAIKQATKILIDDRMFISVIENPHIIPMSKTSEADTLCPGISDRQSYTMILRGGEYVAPRLLPGATGASFKVERRGFTDSERQLLEGYYTQRLGALYYKPYDWSRAFRVEGHIDKLRSEPSLISLLAAIRHHTIDRTIQEPWPQFMADYTVRRIAGIARLYGKDNWHRHPDANYIEARTNISRRSRK
jgi:hypothetical protein